MHELNVDSRGHGFYYPLVYLISLKIIYLFFLSYFLFLKKRGPCLEFFLRYLIHE